ncbi:MAG: hypothetical protein ACP5D2_00660 [Candidatus Nanoarchaeia archaeon]
MKRDKIEGFRFIHGEDTYCYVFPGRIYFYYNPEPFIAEADTSPEFLEKLVGTTIRDRKKLENNPHVDRLYVPVDLVDRVEESIVKNNHVNFLKYVGDLEKYKI